jgi:hypothetical protein
MNAVRRRNQIAGQFSAYLIEMLEHPGFRVLSLAAHRVLSRICIEHAHHGGNENGLLPVTYNQFEEYGIHRHSIGPAIRELVALGFITHRPGRAGNAEHRTPSLFGLTWRPRAIPMSEEEWATIDAANQSRRWSRRKLTTVRETNDWKRRGKTMAEAKRIVAEARGKRG